MTSSDAAVPAFVRPSKTRPETAWWVVLSRAATAVLLVTVGLIGAWICFLATVMTYGMGGDGGDPDHAAGWQVAAWSVMALSGYTALATMLWHRATTPQAVKRRRRVVTVVGLLFFLLALVLRAGLA